ncbi:magnesium transporter [Eremococcus coleocola]|uniref:Magnesium transporter MgtE n=1 Tax=Eremococcus coleocola ACS-139-V-Col8 TaxID=908337 RepID=E4KLR3_9LACT|nr:magnesium transporter [Eremococcus coleocola]EFR31972.1 magnesium transporter [Eremococcus coleocola ACS-139-V-Col8]
MDLQGETILNELTVSRVKHFCQVYHPADVLDIFENLEDNQLIEKMAILPDDYLIEMIELAEEDSQSRLIKLLSVERVSHLFMEMSPDIIVDILGNLPVGTRKHYVKLMTQSDQADIRQLLSYDPESAGGIMTTDFISLKDYWTVDKAFNKIREISPNSEVIDTLFITSNHNRLVGYLPMRDLFRADLQTILADIMNRQVITVEPQIDQEEVAKLSLKYDINVIPVVNPRHVLLGIVTADDILDVLNEEHQEDMLRMSGVNEEEDLDDSFWSSLSKRLPWLTINLLTAFLASFVVGLFESTISQVASLAAAMTIITGMGGNSASQTLALVIQGIALDKIDIHSDRKYILKELAIGIVNGLIIGLMAGGVLYISYHNVYLSLIVVLAMIFNLFNGAFFGYYVPLVLKKMKLDPALASSIFITTATDVLGFFVFLSLANLVLPLLQ